MTEQTFSRELASELATANRILVHHGVLDAFGHVSVRDALNSDHFLLARNMAPGLVTVDDIMAYDLDGNWLDASGRPSYLERFIHASIYKMYPSAKAVVHSHSPSIIPFGVTEVVFKPASHMASFLGAGAPIFEIRETGGPATDMLITDNKLGAALARTLADCPVTLMRGHGNTVVGDSLPEAVFRAVYTEVNARIVAQALVIGQGRVNFLNTAEAERITAANKTQIGRAWAVWKRDVEESR
jgi:ribulose-5-phosphate 4-epimerase/fuculose-1-phosphate aldolase